MNKKINNNFDFISAGLFTFLHPPLFIFIPPRQLPLIMYDNFFQLLLSFFLFHICQLISSSWLRWNTYKDKYWQTMESLAFIITQMSSLLAFFKRGITSISWMINDFLYLSIFYFQSFFIAHAKTSIFIAPMMDVQWSH